MKIVEELDLRSLTRDPGRSPTKIYIERGPGGGTELWIRLGRVSLTHLPSEFGNGTLRALMSNGVTDGDHDSAQVLSIPLIGVRLTGVWNGIISIEGWVRPRPANCGVGFESFKVPKPDYNPLKDAVECNECKDKHLVVPEGFFTPPYDDDLFNAVVGKKLFIYFGNEDR